MIFHGFTVTDERMNHEVDLYDFSLSLIFANNESCDHPEGNFDRSEICLMQEAAVFELSKESGYNRLVCLNK